MKLVMLLQPNKPPKKDFRYWMFQTWWYIRHTRGLRWSAWLVDRFIWKHLNRDGIKQDKW